MKIKIFFIITLLSFVGALSANAQVVPKRMVIQVEVPQELAPRGWARLWSLLSIKALTRPRPEIGTMFTVESSAYAPSPKQTDDTPCITAAGTKVRPGVVASNFLPLGTLLDINGQEFIVEDRMSSRYKGNYIDIWFGSTQEALAFGRKKLEITITGYTDPGSAIRDEKKQEAKPVGRWERIVDRMAVFLNARVLPGANDDDVKCF